MNIKKTSQAKFISVCVSFGFTVGILVYILGFIIGGWLDRHYGTGSWFMLGGVLLAIFCSFFELIQALKVLEKAEKQTNKE